MTECVVAVNLVQYRMWELFESLAVGIFVAFVFLFFLLLLKD